MTTADRLAAAALAVALVAVAIGAWLLVGTGAAVEPPADELLDPFAAASASLKQGEPDLVVVDVEGAVVHPGIVELAAGSRVADAIRAAGGYGSAVDLAAASAQVNLAAIVSDGQQILVPFLGASVGGGGGIGGGGSTGGLVNLNLASPEALDALPGIGPVTVGKIVAAREERPFATLEELVTRDVLTSAQLTKIRDLVTVG